MIEKWIEGPEKEIVLRDYLGAEKSFKNLGSAAAYLTQQIEAWLVFEDVEIPHGIGTAGALIAGHVVMRGAKLTYGASARVFWEDKEIGLGDVLQILVDEVAPPPTEEQPGPLPLSDLVRFVEADDESEKWVDLVQLAYASILDYDSLYASEYRRIYKQLGVDLADTFISLLASGKGVSKNGVGWKDRVRVASLFIREYFSETHELLEEAKEEARLQRQNMTKVVGISKEGADRFNKLYTDQSKYLKDKIGSLEEAFSEQLKLKKPVERWKEAAAEYKKSAYEYAMYLVGALVMGMLFYFVMILKLPEQEHGLLSLQSLRSITLMFLFSAAYFYGLKVLARLVFSSLHLARDAQEREYLTHVYLALIAEGGVVDESSRELVLQALFSRSNTGLLGDDSSPTMPSVSVGDVGRLAGVASRIKS